MWQWDHSRDRDREKDRDRDRDRNRNRSRERGRNRSRSRNGGRARSPERRPRDERRDGKLDKEAEPKGATDRDGRGRDAKQGLATFTIRQDPNSWCCPVPGGGRVDVSCLLPADACLPAPPSPVSGISHPFPPEFDGVDATFGWWGPTAAVNH